MFRAKQLSLSPDSGAGTPFSGGWSVTWGLEAEEVWLLGMDKVFPKSFSPKTVRVASHFVFDVRRMKSKQITCVWLPYFPREEWWLSVLGCFL